MKRIFWLSNVDLTDSTLNKSGTWIHSMFRSLKQSVDVQICANVTFTPLDIFYSKEEGCVTHYYVPNNETKTNGFPTAKAIEYVVNAIIKENPDLVHVWGMELCWGLITKDKRLDCFDKLIEIQGIKSVCSFDYWANGGLPKSEIRKMRSLAQWLLPKYRIEKTQSRFAQWEKAEADMLSSVNHINTQSEWVRNVISFMTDNPVIHKTGIILRPVFMNSTPWYELHQFNESPVIFTTTSTEPRKGLHVTLEAFKLVKSRYPKASLIVAGMNRWKPNLLRGGYEKYIFYKIKDLGLDDSVILLGNVTEDALLENMYKADVFVNSSFIETYCLALAEALAIGVPSVVSYSSALPELIVEGETGFLYPVGDRFVCAAKIIKLLSDSALSKSISLHSSEWYRKEKNEKKVVNMQVETYLSIISGNN